MTSGRPKLSISLVWFTLALVTITLAFVDDARATGNFNPEVSATFSTTAPGSHPDITGTFNIGLGPDGLLMTPDDTGDYNFAGIVSFSPSSPQDADVPDGAVLGTLSYQPILGILNGSCVLFPSVPVSSSPSLMEATTDINNTVEPLPYGQSNDLAIIAGDIPPFDGVANVKPPPAVTQYPSYLNAIFDPDWMDYGPDKIAGNADDSNGPLPPIQPRFRFVGTRSIPAAGNLWVVVQQVVFEPGTDLPNLPPFDPSLGYPSVTVLQQASAAGFATPSASAPGLLTDFCTPLKTDSQSYGVTRDNPDTPANEGGVNVRTLPAAGTQITSISFSVSQSDADNDGYENTLDSCPFHANTVWNPRDPTPPIEGDSDMLVFGQPLPDGIPDTCDPTPTEPTFPPGGHPTDHDGDGFLNRGDNCPVYYNPDQADGDVNAAGEVVGDGIGDACDTAGTDGGTDCVDVNCSGGTPRPIPLRTAAGNGPLVPDGHNHTCVRTIAVTVGGPNVATVSPCNLGLPGDSDADGVPDVADNCPATPNPGQQDEDSDGVGDACDNCPTIADCGYYHPVTPHRILDTRPAEPAPGPKGKVGQNAEITVDVTGGPSGVPDTNVSAVVVNVTGTQATDFTYLTVYPSGEPRPLASNLNFGPGVDFPNLVTVKVGVDGKVKLYNAVGSTHVIFDVAGWYGEPAGGSLFNPLVPKRILDTRALPKIPPDSEITVDVTDTLDSPVPAGASAVVLNTTATQGTAPSFLTVYPSDATRPLASNLNFVAGQDIPNLVIVKVGGADGSVKLYNAVGFTHVIFDVVGWYGASGHLFHPVTPARILDTRSTPQGDPPGKVGPNAEIIVDVTTAKTVPVTASSVIVNTTATQGTIASYLTVYPSGVAQPLASNLNFKAGQDIPNLVIVGVGTGGNVQVYNKNGEVHVIFDAVGYFAP